MSLPPQTIRIKRKAADDSPVSFLRVQETKRHRTDHFVYQRQNREAKFAEPTPQPQRPVIHTFQGKSQPKSPHKAPEPATENPNVIVTDSSGNDNNASPIGLHARAEPRQFHISRQDMIRPSSPTPNRTRGGVTKKRQAPAVFVERKIKQISSRKLNKFRSTTDAPAHDAYTDSAQEDDDMELDPRTPPRKYKKPGVAKLTASRENLRGEPPQAVTERWRNVNVDQLSAEMNAYTMEQIGMNIRQSEEEEQRRRNAAKKQTPTSPSQLKYKPKAPSQRYAERRPRKTPDMPDKAMADADDHMSDGSDDGDYIIETYVRVPASRIGEHVNPQTVGLLVFEGEDAEFFYGNDSDSDDEWAEDDEDENAENYYTADYPDDEVASDDEYGQNAYAYRNGNASDLEEYDADSDDGMHHSGDENNVEGRFAKFSANYSKTQRNL